MRLHHPLLLPAVTAAVGFMAGRFLGNDSNSGRADSQIPPRQAAAGTSARQASGASGHGRAVYSPGPTATAEAAGRTALADTLESRRLGRWLRMVEKMTAAEAPAVFALLMEERLNGRTYQAEATLFWQTWAALDPAAALKCACDHPDAGGTDGAEAVLKAWAMTDAAGAGGALEAMDDSPLTRKALSGFMHGLAESDPAAAVKFASTRLPEEMQTEAAVHVTGSMIFKLGNKGAVEWFDSLPADVPSRFTTETARVVIESLSRSSPGEVEKFALARLGQPWAGQFNEQNFTASMIRRNGGSPIAYIAEATAAHPQPHSWSLAATSIRDPRTIAEANEWIRTNPDHPSRDAIIAGTARNLRTQGRHDEAAAMLQQIKDRKLAAEIAPGN